MSDITLEGDTAPRPIGGIGLPALGKLLVQVCISPKQYEEDRRLGNGHDLEAKPCASTRSLAYQFRPEVTVTAAAKPLPVPVGSKVVEIKKDGKVTGGERVGGKPQTQTVDPEKLLPGATDKQVVPYWRNCRANRDLPDHFKPNAIVDLMRPEDPAVDRLGILKRLRVVSATYTALAERLATTPEEVPATPLEGIRAERERLQQMLRQLRTQLLALLSRDNRTLMEDGEILRNVEGDGAFDVLEKQRERRRLEALLK